MRNRASCFLLVLLTPLGSCVTYRAEPEAGIVAAAPVRVPLHREGSTEAERAVDAYYASIVQQLQDALLGSDLPAIEDLLGRHARESAPDWAQEHFVSFRRAAVALRFELRAAEASVLEAADDIAPLGEEQLLELRIPDDGGTGIAIPGRDGSLAPTQFLVSVVVQDFDCLGDRTRRSFSQRLTLESARGETPVKLPFRIDALRPEGCYRKVDLVVEMLPGVLLLADDPVPNRKVELARLSYESYPRGIESVRKNPYTHLKRGLELGDPKHFNNVFLAARSMNAEFRADALVRLMHHLRQGRPDIARVCMASLRELTGEDISVDDRDGWLQWWDQEGRAATVPDSNKQP